jgi:acetyl esterase/lipase
MEDAARAIAWCFEHADEYGFDRSKIFIGGMSAGAYLAAITVMNPAFLAPYNLSYKDFAGLLLISGQMTTHFRVKADLGRNNGPYNPLVDEYAPFSFLSTDLPPMLLVSGDPALDIPARPEENAFFAASLKAMGHPFVRCFSLQGHGHVPAFHSCNHLVTLFLKDVLAGEEEKK